MNKNCAKVGHTEEYEDHTFDGDGGTYLEESGNRMFEAYNPDTGLSARIESRIIDGGGVVNDSDCEIFVWDRASDSKYYRKTPPFNPEEGKKLVSVMEVQFGTSEY